ncbi:hypothetical protein RB200_05910 [Streptomyces sp. PmtG]
MILILAGVGVGLLVFLGDFDRDSGLMTLLGTAKVIAIGLVLSGTTLLTRRQGPGKRE